MPCRDQILCKNRTHRRKFVFPVLHVLALMLRLSNSHAGRMVCQARPSDPWRRNSPPDQALEQEEYKCKLPGNASKSLNPIKQPAAASFKNSLREWQARWKSRTRRRGPW
jgi:hypothetical protein